MIIAVTTFVLPQPVTLEQARAIFRSTAPKYREMAGLSSKRYILSEDGRTAGGIYMWESRRHAEAVYTDEWRAFVRGKYGTDPVVTYYETPVLVDNVAGRIEVDE